ncbi:hypothetical protein [Nocardia vinacea]|uniref:hypothetical protein n=1 Tax=Nocardia vinacea TaxID=96468 RepID=UPI0002F59E93|nr:hypothetical protein [Nocardia vinacea]
MGEALYRLSYGGAATLSSRQPDRALVVGDGLSASVARVWQQVGTGVPTLLEVAGLPDPEAADIDLPLMQAVESRLDDLLSVGFSLEQAEYDGTGTPTGTVLTTRRIQLGIRPIGRRLQPCHPRAAGRGPESVGSSASPGTRFGEPGNRQLPRQTHQRILKTFARGTLTVTTEKD